MFQESFPCLGLPECDNEVGEANGICENCMCVLNERVKNQRKDVSYSSVADLIKGK